MVLVTSPVGGFHLCNCRAAIWTSFTLFNCTTQIWILSGMRLLCPEKKSPSVLKDLRDSRALLQLCRGMLEVLHAVTYFVNTFPDKHSKKKKKKTLLVPGILSSSVICGCACNFLLNISLLGPWKHAGFMKAGGAWGHSTANKHSLASREGRWGGGGAERCCRCC